MGTKKAHYVFHIIFSNRNSIHSNSSKKLVKVFEEHMMNVFLESIMQELELTFLERFIWSDLPLSFRLDVFIFAFGWHCTTFEIMSNVTILDWGSPNPKWFQN
jgi:hypothetical protein